MNIMVACEQPTTQGLDSNDEVCYQTLYSLSSTALQLQAKKDMNERQRRSDDLGTQPGSNTIYFAFLSKSRQTSAAYD